MKAPIFTKIIHVRVQNESETPTVEKKIINIFFSNYCTKY